MVPVMMKEAGSGNMLSVQVRSDIKAVDALDLWQTGADYPQWAGPTLNSPISVYRLGEMPIQSCGQCVSAPRGEAGARLNAHTELRIKHQRSAREAIYRIRPIVLALSSSSTTQSPLYEPLLLRSQGIP
jgi:hypothetical protein